MSQISVFDIFRTQCLHQDFRTASLFYYHNRVISSIKERAGRGMTMIWAQGKHGLSNSGIASNKKMRGLPQPPPPAPPRAPTPCPEH